MKKLSILAVIAATATPALADLSHIDANDRNRLTISQGADQLANDVLYPNEISSR